MQHNYLDDPIRKKTLKIIGTFVNNKRLAAQMDEGALSALSGIEPPSKIQRLERGGGGVSLSGIINILAIFDCYLTIEDSHGDEATKSVILKKLENL